jgi:hypothetical protein
MVTAMKAPPKEATDKRPNIQAVMSGMPRNWVSITGRDPMGRSVDAGMYTRRRQRDTTGGPITRRYYKKNAGPEGPAVITGRLHV